VLVLLFDSSGIVQMEFIWGGETMNKHAIRRSSAVYTIQFVLSILSFDAGRTACCYTTFLTSLCACSRGVGKIQVTIFPHPPCSADLTPCNFMFFPCLKDKLNWRWFQWVEKIINATSFPAAFPTTTNLHRGQRQLFWGRMWVCVSVCIL
jgi:hypothetical protein